MFTHCLAYPTVVYIVPYEKAFTTIRFVGQVQLLLAKTSAC